MRQYSMGDAMHTGVLPLMYLILLCASAVSLFASLVSEYVGERSARQTNAAVYSAKAFGGNTRRRDGGPRTLQ